MARDDSEKGKKRKKSEKSKKKIWDRKNPRSKSKKMTVGQKRKARKAAKSQGRDTPSLVDNINAQKGRDGKKSKTKKSKTKRSASNRSGKSRK